MVKYNYRILKHGVNLFQGYNYIKDFQYMVKYNYYILKNLFQGYNYIKIFQYMIIIFYHTLKNLFQGYNYIKDFSMYGKIYLPYIEKSFPRL